MDVDEIKASPEYRKVGHGYLIVSAAELNNLIRENIALKKDLKSLGDVSHDSCILCAKRGTLECAETSFEWRGIVAENEPTPEEEAELRNRLVARERR